MTQCSNPARAQTSERPRTCSCSLSCTLLPDPKLQATWKGRPAAPVELPAETSHGTGRLVAGLGPRSNEGAKSTP